MDVLPLFDGTVISTVSVVKKLFSHPTMVPTPMELDGPNTSANDVKSSGADEPAARNVAPATSGVNSSTYYIESDDDARGI